VRLIRPRQVLLGSVTSVVVVAAVLLGLRAGRRSPPAAVPDTTLPSIEAVLRRDGLGAAFDVDLGIVAR
jgi:hypothetical protein